MQAECCFVYEASGQRNINDIKKSLRIKEETASRNTCFENAVANFKE